MTSSGKGKGKRPQRPCRESINEMENENDIADSSPSRPPPKRRRRTAKSHADSSNSNQQPPNPPAPELDDKEATIARVTQHLGLPGIVQVSIDHADEKHTMESRDGISAFAKLAGKGWTYYIKELSISVGRNSTDEDQGSHHEDVNIDVGPNKMTSRHHAQIYYQDGWRIHVLGRNGVKLDDNPTMIERNQCAELHSGSIINISNIEMMFVLPVGDLNIDPIFIQRAERNEDTEEVPAPQTFEESTADLLSLPSTNGARGPDGARSQNGAPQAIAPAPPNYQRPNTPSASRPRRPGSMKRSPSGYMAGGTVVMNDAESIDLSLDSNSHIKPGYSYAQMIAQAIIFSPNEARCLSDIYQAIMARYAYYRHRPPHGWQNSIRHNLSLSKTYEKFPREKGMPGKGMIWKIVPEVYEDIKALAYAPPGRAGHRGSSQPTSPNNTGTRNIKDEFDPISPLDEKQSSSSGSPRRSSYPSQRLQTTPDRAPRLQHLQPGFPGDGSPLPRHRRVQNTTVGLSDNIPGSPPILSSSYQQDEGNSFITPAPLRVIPHLAPPSTAQRPSQVMPTSSPAPFWKYAGETPNRSFNYDMSPVRGSNVGVILPSSSPPPMRRGSAISPIRNSVSGKLGNSAVDDLEEEEEQGFDLAKGFQSIGSYHAPVPKLQPEP